MTLEKEQIESALVEAFQKLDDGVSEGPAKEGVIHIDITDDVIKPQNVKNDVTKKNDDFIAQSPTNSWTVVDEDFGYEQIWNFRFTVLSVLFRIHSRMPSINSPILKNFVWQTISEICCCMDQHWEGRNYRV